MNLILTILLLLTASSGWTYEKCLEKPPSYGLRPYTRNYECELKKGHDKNHFHTINDGMSIEWETDWSSEFVKELEAENRKLKGELIGYKIANEELKKKLDQCVSKSTIVIKDNMFLQINNGPAFCEKYGHCYYPLKFGSHIHDQHIDDTEFIKGEGVHASVISPYWDEMCKHCKKRRHQGRAIPVWVEEEQ